MAPRRPSAFDVSFPEEARAAEAAEQESLNRPAMQPRSSSAASTSSLGKRKALNQDDMAKRQQLPKAAYYQKKKREILEDDKLVIIGEDGDDEDSDGEKPIRELHGFSVFDPKHRNEMVSLEALEQDDGVDRQFEAAGDVVPSFINDEDAGQEEDMEPQYVHLSSILRYTMDYTDENEPFYIETQYAWYLLKAPSASYQPFYHHFYTPRRIAQLVISRALRHPQEGFAAFLKLFTSKVDIFGRTYLETHLWESVLYIQEAIQDEPEPKKIMAVPFVRHILRNTLSPNDSFRPTREKGPKRKPVPMRKGLIGNPDLAVLKAENQNPTRVTPRIAKLAQGLFREELMVVGGAPPPVNKAEEESNRKKMSARLRRLISRTLKGKKKINYTKDDRISLMADLYTAVSIEGTIYRVGDVVIVPGENLPNAIVGDKVHLEPDSRVDHYFWFGKIMYIIMENQVAHVQWFNHGSQTVIRELAHPQELFLSNDCGQVNLHDIVDKVTVHMGTQASPLQPEEYFCKFMHCTKVGSYTSIDMKHLELCATQLPPNNCSVCLLREESDMEAHPRELRDEYGNPDGVAFAGTLYHLEDFVHYRAEVGPANIGYITHIEIGKESKVTVRKVGRISHLGDILPEKVVRDERHLYLTEEQTSFKVKDLLRVIYVPCYESFQGPQATVEGWVEDSFDQYYLRYCFPRLNVTSWAERRRVSWEELHVCTPCCKERLRRRSNMKRFLAGAREKPLAVLDLFGGVGAFSRGLSEGSGSLTVAYAIEIGPSAARSFLYNSPETVVYNQCANEMLRYTIKSQQGHEVEVPKQKFNDRIPVPPPPRPGEIDVITAGFPCQSHSSLNMYKDANDVKSNLILTTLSFLDYYSPSFAYFENVPGFLRFSLNAVQANQHKVEGGLEMGGLKFLIRALLDMNYQVRFALLQAAHYGTPQRRVRFFLIAAKDGDILPELPQPTHDFPDSQTLDIKIGRGKEKIVPIRTAHGTAAHSFVTIGDAISDLPRFDWKHPRPEKEKPEKRKERRKREANIPSLECNSSKPYCGFQGQIGYFHPAKTTYQERARRNSTSDIQQYTKTVIPAKAERCVNIPLHPKADYHHLAPDQQEWQTVDPSSAVGRKGYLPGWYGRLDKDGVFPTTVTNVDPTAKQSRVLNPYCYRMVTVRELARSQGFPDDFVFEAIGDNVVTMHRQIGNAVPLPVGYALGRELREALFTKWIGQREQAIVIEDDEDHARNVDDMDTD
ncbi:hypothetical protein M413DRAFT_15837 [Hebeloma cylindrosporum]|uniref:DNA (cytosine-5-)-methyltransferase n=1 Tax=Hebeloma cylindrosporum TaxID=76867 RepID=A0A0C3CG32_HEBCY|nr:hypothetical protein M413DRAFT_15837 [Hebeloma cylindrosporum h7]